MKVVVRVLTMLGAVIAIIASFLNDSGHVTPVDFLRGLACGLLLSGFAIQGYTYFKNRRTNTLHRESI